MKKITLTLSRREALDLHNLILGELFYSSGVWKKKLDRIKKELEEQLFYMEEGEEVNVHNKKLNGYY